jgi:hypothetical protein
MGLGERQPSVPCSSILRHTCARMEHQHYAKSTENVPHEDRPKRSAAVNFLSAMRVPSGSGELLNVMLLTESKRTGRFDLPARYGCFGGCKSFTNCLDSERQRPAAHD